MDELTLNEFEALAPRFNAVVGRTDGVDGFCSSSHWIIPALRAFHADHTPWLYRSADGLRWGAMALGHSPTVGRFVAPLESMWGLATPFIGDDQQQLAEDIATVIADREEEWDALWLSGLRRPSAVFNHLVRTFGARYRVGLGPTTQRHVASLEGGWEGFLSRRASSFRRNLRRSERMADREGIRFESYAESVPVEAAAELYRRILNIETRSWKGRSGQGINDGAMESFYGHMLPSLSRVGGLRAVIAKNAAGADIAYVFGAVFGESFRGLQVSFDDAYRTMSLGNIMQAQMIRLLCQQGIRFYDLGSDLPYKTRWSEPGLATVTLAVFP